MTSVGYKYQSVNQLEISHQNNNTLLIQTPYHSALLLISLI